MQAGGGRGHGAVMGGIDGLVVGPVAGIVGPLDIGRQRHVSGAGEHRHEIGAATIETHGDESVLILGCDFSRQRPVEGQGLSDLEALAGQPAEAVFLALVDVLAPVGATIDQALARLAMLDAVTDLAEVGLLSFDSLSADQLRDFFIAYVAHSIERRIMVDIGRNGAHRPASAATAVAAQQQMREHITGCVRLTNAKNSIGGARQAIASLRSTMNTIYESAYQVLLAGLEEA